MTLSWCGSVGTPSSAGVQAGGPRGCVHRATSAGPLKSVAVNPGLPWERGAAQAWPRPQVRPQSPQQPGPDQPGSRRCPLACPPAAEWTEPEIGPRLSLGEAEFSPASAVSECSRGSWRRGCAGGVWRRLGARSALHTPLSIDALLLQRPGRLPHRLSCGGAALQPVRLITQPTTAASPGLSCTNQPAHVSGWRPHAGSTEPLCRALGFACYMLL